MQSTFSELEDRLSDLVERHENVAQTLAALDALLADHRAELPERLAHFLEKRSYQKALAYLRDGDTGHHP